MIWKVGHVEEQRFRFIEEQRRGDLSLTELCKSDQISRPTAYKWIERFTQQGVAGLADRSTAPRHRARETAPGVIELILALKAEHSFWGARKLLAHLKTQSPQQRWPAASTVGELLKHHGLTIPRKRTRQRFSTTNQSLTEADRPNHVWCIDFKGWFKTGDGKRCDPLTLTDNFSRMLFRCQSLDAEKTVFIKPVMVSTFLEYGLPDCIRSDNGAPFASNGESGLTALSVWWIRLGIMPERIQPGCPQQNGRHERMHLTLQQQTASPPAATIREQQKRFDRFREEYNQVRPHEALNQKPPAQIHQPSARAYPSRLPQVEYLATWEKRKVCAAGMFKFKGQTAFASHALEGQYIGLEPIADRYWQMWFGGYQMGIFDQTDGRIYSLEAWKTHTAKLAAKTEAKARG